jgi:hypothetical protein
MFVYIVSFEYSPGTLNGTGIAVAATEERAAKLVQEEQEAFYKPGHDGKFLVTSSYLFCVASERETESAEIIFATDDVQC